MKKNAFMEGAVIATLGIILVKFIGLIYVIPFNAIIGEKGGALYGYGYNIYNLFLSVSSAGFPFAISKITSEYSALGYKYAINKTYKIATTIISIISIVTFLLLFIFAPQIGHLIIGNSTGGNSIEDIAFVIRMVSFAILIIPFLSVSKGFLQGHKYIKLTTDSQIIEQIVRVLIIVIGSYVALRIFHTDLKIAVGIAVSGAFFGGLVACLFLNFKIKKAKLLSNTRKEENNNNIQTKEIIRKIITYSIPFIVVSLIYNLYNTVDMILVSRTMGDILHIPMEQVESVLGVFTTWGVKLNNILLAVTTGLTTSLIPNIVSSYTKNDMKDVNAKFNKALQCTILIILPATIFLSLLVKPVWMLFYGNSNYGPIVYKLFVFTALFGGLHSVVANTLQGLSKYKLVIICVLTGLVINTICDVPFMLISNKLGFEVSYGAIIAAILGYSLSTIIALIVLIKKYKFSFSDTLKRLPSYILATSIFVLVILGLKLIIPINLTGRIIQIPILLIYGLLSFGVYFGINYYMGNLSNLLDRRNKFEDRNSK